MRPRDRGSGLTLPHQLRGEKYKAFCIGLEYHRKKYASMLASIVGSRLDQVQPQHAG